METWKKDLLAQADDLLKEAGFTTYSDALEMLQECARCRDALLFNPELYAKLKNFEDGRPLTTGVTQ